METRANEFDDILNSRWVKRFRPPPPGGPHLVCFPHAGGSASAYAPLSAALAGSVDVLGVQYPGRLDRRAEPPVENAHVLADVVFDLLLGSSDDPVAFFGHSMGSVLAFEVARRMEAASRPVRHLFVSGGRAPHLSRDRGVRLLSDDRLVSEVEALGGVPKGVLSSDDVRSVLLPPIRADYHVVETYRYEERPALTTPITVFTGDRDPAFPVEDAPGWQEHTLGRFALHVFDGDHFYLARHWPAIADVVGKTLR